MTQVYSNFLLNNFKNESEKQIALFQNLLFPKEQNLHKIFAITETLNSNFIEKNFFGLDLLKKFVESAVKNEDLSVEKLCCKAVEILEL